jgi:hypothetical protein
LRAEGCGIDRFRSQGIPPFLGTTYRSPGRPG